MTLGNPGLWLTTKVQTYQPHLRASGDPPGYGRSARIAHALILDNNFYQAHNGEVVLQWLEQCQRGPLIFY